MGGGRKGGEGEAAEGGERREEEKGRKEGSDSLVALTSQTVTKLCLSRLRLQ